MISINEARINGFQYLRFPKWSNREDYIKLDYVVMDGERLLGPWVHLYSPMNEEINGRNPVDLLITEFDLDEVKWEIWAKPNVL